MHESSIGTYKSKSEFYAKLTQEIESLAQDHWLTNLANVSASLKENLSEVNWVGFYLMHEGKLILGPFQGKVACTTIALGKGVCGTSAARRETILVEDVDQFPGHIVCDSASRSEIVIPIVFNEKVIGVLDIDSPLLARFDDEDRKGLETIVGVLIKNTTWPRAI